MQYQEKNKKKVAIFDLDGTLIDSGRKLQTDVIEAFARLGKDINPEQLGKNWYELAESLGISREKFDEEYDKRKPWKQSLKDGDVLIFPEAHEVLSELKNRDIRISLLSKSIPDYTRTKLDYFDLGKYFEQVATIHPREPSKVEGALDLVKKLNPSTIQKAYFIGDKEEDVSVARDVNQKYNLPTEGICVNRNGEQLKNYHNIRSLEEILNIIRG